MGVTVGGFYLEDTVTEFHDGDIEGTATEVVNGDLHVLVLLVEAVCQSCCSRLVDDSLDIQTGDLSRLLGCLTLRIREVCGDCDDSLGNLLTEIILSGLLHLLENHCGNLLRRIVPSFDLDSGSVVLTPYYSIRNPCDFLADLVIGLTHEPLDGEDGVLGVCDSLTFCGVSDLTLSAVSESDDRRSCPLSFVVDDDCRLVTFHNCDAAVGGTKVYSDNFSHDYDFLFFSCCSLATFLG